MSKQMTTFAATVCIVLAAIAMFLAPAGAQAAIIAGDVIAVDLANDESAANYNVIDTGNLNITAGNVIRWNDGAVVSGVSLTLTVATTDTGFNNDGNANAWPGTGADPYYVGAADDILYANDVVTLTFAGLDDALSYNVRIYSLTSNLGDREDDFTVTDGAGTQELLDSTGDSRWDAATLVAGGTVFNGLSTDGAGNIVVTGTPPVGDNQLILNAFILEAVPEPATLALLGIGGLGLLIRRRRRA